MKTKVAIAFSAAKPL